VPLAIPPPARGPVASGSTLENRSTSTPTPRSSIAAAMNWGTPNRSLPACAAATGGGDEKTSRFASRSVNEAKEGTPPQVGVSRTWRGTRCVRRGDHHHLGVGGGLTDRSKRRLVRELVTHDDGVGRSLAGCSQQRVGRGRLASHLVPGIFEEGPHTATARLDVPAMTILSRPSPNRLPPRCGPACMVPA
jgi:hypothetical protein